MTGAENADSLLKQASRLYLTAPAEAVRLAELAQATLDAGAPATLRARAAMVRGVALTYASEYEASLAALQQALALAPADALALRVDVLRATAVAYEQMDALDLSLDWAVQAAEVARALGEPIRLADTLLSVGVVRSRNGDTETGLQHARDALAIYQANNDAVGSMQALNNVGICCKNLGRHEEALVHVTQAFELAREAGQDGAMAVAASNRPEPLWKLGRIAEARVAAADAVARLERAGYRAGEAHARLQHGQLMLADGEPALAQAELERALQLAEKVGSRKYTAGTHQALAELHKSAGRFEAALRHHEAFHAAERLQFDESSSRKMRALQVHFDLARARHDAQLARLETARLAEQTRTDALTGLANRRHLDEALATELQRARHLGHPLSLALADVDDFKQINDRFGHAAGDRVLRTVADLLRSHCRALDVVARYGGEEFCIVFVEAGRGDALRACEDMRRAVAGHDWAALQPGLAVTLSFGLADPGAADDAAALLATADGRLYAAKRAGKDRVVSAGSSP